MALRTQPVLKLVAVTQRSALKVFRTNLKFTFRNTSNQAGEPSKQVSFVKKHLVKGLLALSAVGGAAYFGFQQFDTKKEETIEWVDISNLSPSRHIKFKGYCLPGFMSNVLKEIKDFEVKSDDVWMAGFPKSGTTWLQEIVYLIVNDCDFEKAKSKNIELRVPYIEFPAPGINYIRQMTDSPRLIKTHLPLSMLPEDVDKKCKVLYVVRNPKDAIVSFYHFIKMLHEFGYSGDFNDFFEASINGETFYGPWWKQVNEYSNSKAKIIYYEDIKEKPFETIKSICEYLGKNLSDEKINSIIKWCSLESMRAVSFEGIEDENILQLFRKGQIGDWVNYFSEAQSKRLDQVIRRSLKPQHEFNYGLTAEEAKSFFEAKAKQSLPNNPV